MILLQLLFGIIGVYLLAKTAEIMLDSRMAFVITAIIYSASSFVSIYDNYGISESFSINTLICSIFFFAMFLKSNRTGHLFLSGFFMTWSIFIRPVAGPYIFLMLLIFFIVSLKNRSFEVVHFFKRSVVFMSSFVLFISVWTIRNYAAFGQFIPLQMPIEKDYTNAFPRERMATVNFIISQGESPMNWTDYTLGDWFYGSHSDFDLEKLHYTSVFNRDSIINVRNYYRQTKNPALNQEERLRYKTLTADLAEQYSRSLQTEAPFYYYVVAKTKLIGKFLFPRTYMSPLPFPELKEMNFIQKAIKGGNFILLYLVTLAGLAGMVISFIKKEPLLRGFSLFPLSLIIIIPTVIGYIELRYYAHIYIFMIIFATYATHSLRAFFNNSKIT